MHNPDHDAAPFNTIPPVVLILFCAIAGIELFFQAGEAGYIGAGQGLGWRLSYANQFGFLDRIQDWMITNHTMRWDYMMRYVTYSFIHQSFGHAMFVCVFLLALGKFVSEVLRPWAVGIIFFASASIGAVGYSLILDDSFLLVGGYPAVYGLIGAFTFVMFTGLTTAGKSGLPAFSMIAMFMTFQAIFKMLFGGSNEWLAELIGFATGFALTSVLAPGGRARLAVLLGRLRAR